MKYIKKTFLLEKITKLKLYYWLVSGNIHTWLKVFYDFYEEI